MKLHLISLEQDSERVQEEMSQFEYNMDSKDYQSLEIEDISLNGQIIATRHLLSVATDILGIQTEEK
jgi:vesicle coat complex subunit